MTQPIQDRLISYLDAFERAIVDIAPQAAEAALMWARIDAISGLVYAVVGLTVSVFVFFRVIAPMWRWGLEEGEESAGFSVFLCSLAAAPWAGASLWALLTLTSVWRWVGAFYPEMWIIHKAASAVTG